MSNLDKPNPYGSGEGYSDGSGFGYGDGSGDGSGAGNGDGSGYGQKITLHFTGD